MGYYIRILLKTDYSSNLNKCKEQPWAGFLAVWYGGALRPLGGVSGRVASHWVMVSGGEGPGSVDSLRELAHLTW